MKETFLCPKVGTTSPLLLGDGDVILSAEDFSALADVTSVELEDNIIYDMYIYRYRANGFAL